MLCVVMFDDAVNAVACAGRTDLLMYFRLYSFFHCLVIAVAQLRRAGTACLYFYTVSSGLGSCQRPVTNCGRVTACHITTLAMQVWSYWLLILYFGLASVASIRARLRPKRPGVPVTPDLLEYWVRLHPVLSVLFIAL